MLLTIIFASAMQATGIAPLAYGHACRDARQNIGLNLPPQRNEKATEVVHASIVAIGDDVTGVLYLTRSGALWYQDGPINRPNPASPTAIRKVLSALQLQPPHAGAGSFNRIPAVGLTDVLAGEISLNSCF